MTYTWDEKLANIQLFFFKSDRAQGLSALSTPVDSVRNVGLLAANADAGQRRVY